MNQITERDFTIPSYVEEVEQRFGSLRRRVVNFTGDDYQIVKAWEEEQIPLPVVIRTLEDEFRKKDGDIGTIRYFRDIVPRRAKQQASAMTGGRREQPVPASSVAEPVEDRLQGRLFALVEELQSRADAVVEPLRTTFEAVAFELGILAQSGAHVVFVLERLESFDEQLVAAAVESLAPEERDDIERRATRTLSPAQLGDPAARAVMLQTMVRGGARQRFRLGSLFDSIQEALQ